MSGERATALHHRGRWPPPPGPRIAVVGSRRPTPYGEAVAERLGMDLARAGAAVLSGLAVGVDAAAHRGALEAGGYTAAILGTGVDVIYPRANAALAERVLAAGGALVSEFGPGTQPQRGHFPRRNWTLASLCDAVVVVEAAGGSGALITAEAGIALGREVLAVPGSVFSPLSVGCHQLIRDGAALVQNARDVMGAIGRQLEVLDDPLHPPDRVGPAPSAGRDPLLNHLSDVLPLEAGTLARKLGLPFAAVISRLSALELDGLVVRISGGYVRRQRRAAKD